MGKKCVLTFLRSPHAPLARYRGEMRSNTVGFVLQQKLAALNLHGPSHTLPQVPVEAEYKLSVSKSLPVYVVK